MIYRIKIEAIKISITDLKLLTLAGKGRLESVIILKHLNLYSDRLLCHCSFFTGFVISCELLQFHQLLCFCHLCERYPCSSNVYSEITTRFPDSLSLMCTDLIKYHNLLHLWHSGLCSGSQFKRPCD